jgi:hypothetical protein
MNRANHVKKFAWFPRTATAVIPESDPSGEGDTSVSAPRLDFADWAGSASRGCDNRTSHFEFANHSCRDQLE